MRSPSSIATSLSQDSLSLPPDIRDIAPFMSRVRELLFPANKPSVSTIVKRLDWLRAVTISLVHQSLATHQSHHEQTPDIDADTIAHALIDTLPAIRQKSYLDIEAALRGDPAARDAAEVVQYYPGFKAVLSHRIAHVLHLMKVPYIPRGIAELAHAETGIDIHPGATVGDGLFIDHGTGVVVGETAIIGENVKLYQGVTLGALSLPKNNLVTPMNTNKRHPTIEDNVTIYANATVLGGATVIGHDSVIGASAWVRESIPPYSKVGHDARTIIRSPEEK